MDGAKKDNKKKRDNYSQNAAMKKTPHISYVRNICGFIRCNTILFLYLHLSS